MKASDRGRNVKSKEFFGCFDEFCISKGNEFLRFYFYRKSVTTTDSLFVFDLEGLPIPRLRCSCRSDEWGQGKRQRVRMINVSFWHIREALIKCNAAS